MKIRTSQSMLFVIGMRGNECREKIINALLEVDGVLLVNISLYRGFAIIVHNHEVDDQALVKKISDIGYMAFFKEDDGFSRDIQGMNQSAIEKSEKGT